MDKSFPMLSVSAAVKIAKRTRAAFVTGQMDRDTFLSKRARQSIVAHNRFETLLVRAYPNHKPDFITATVGPRGEILPAREHSTLSHRIQGIA